MRPADDAATDANEAFYQPGHRQLQDGFDSRRLADRLEEVTVADTLSDRDRRLIEQAPFLWLATTDRAGWPEVSYKGGAPGFVHVFEDRRLRFPSYDGNGMYRSLGNIVDDERVGLLFCRFEPPWRLRLRGRARLIDEPEALACWPGAEAVVEVDIEVAFPNCGRYVHRDGDDVNVHVPAAGYSPPDPDWKSLDAFAPYLPGVGEGGSAA